VLEIMCMYSDHALMAAATTLICRLCSGAGTVGTMHRLEMIASSSKYQILIFGEAPPLDRLVTTVFDVPRPTLLPRGHTAQQLAKLAELLLSTFYQSI
jgi:hypothetical protein